MLQASSIIWLVLGATLFGVVMRVTVPPLAWIALTLLLHASRSLAPVTGLASVGAALYVALAFGLRGMLPATGGAYYALIAFYATTMTVPFAVDRLTPSTFGDVGASLMFPLAWVAAEFLRSRLTPAASWGSIAYTQYGCLPLMQVAAFAGIWGITFIVTWSAPAFDHVWRHGFEWTAVRTPVLTYVAAVGAVVVAGALRVALAPAERPSIRVATLSPPVDFFAPREMTRISEGAVPALDRDRVAVKLRSLHDWFLDGSRREARAGARLIAWPEQNLLVFASDEAAFLERARHLAAGERVYLAMGIGTVYLDEPRPFENKLVFVDPSGRIIESYRKSHPVPGWEAGIMRVGDGHVPLLRTPYGRVAGAICFDADFPEFIRQAAQGSADILIVVANEWKAIKDSHLQMQAFRAVETGIPMVRAAGFGMSAVFDPWGRPLAMTDAYAASDGALSAQLPVGRTPTAYGKIGDLFAWACVACLAFALAAGAFSYRYRTAITGVTSVAQQ